MSKPFSGQELKIEVNDLTIAAQRWDNGSQDHPEDNCRRILCLHGWLDNSASFNRLAPLLKGYEVVALDLAGHGKTSHRSRSGSYDIWDDLEDIDAVADQLNWDTFHLLGHSRGAIISMLMAVSMPRRLEQIMLLDGILPMLQELSFAEQMRNYLRGRRKTRTRRKIIYKNTEQALDKRLMLSDMPKADLAAIVERDLEQHGDGVAWRHDARLHTPSAMKLEQRHVESICGDLSKPLLLLIANEGRLITSNLLEQIPAVAGTEYIHRRYHPGGHHFHAETAHVESVANELLLWLASHPGNQLRSL